MTARARQIRVEVTRRERLSPHLVRLVLAGPALQAFQSTGAPDEWVGLVVPGQFQSRYYTVRHWSADEMVLDVVLHESGLVTQWVRGDCVGDEVTLTEPKGSFTLPADATWVRLVGDLTGLPAIARIGERLTAEAPGLDLTVWAEVADELPGYLPPGLDVTWSTPPEDGGSALADLVESMPWPESPGYFWMAGESAQMRAIRKNLSQVRRLPSSSYNVMGYWRRVSRRQPRAVDPGPIWAAGKAAGHTDEQIWAAYDAAGEEGAP